MGIFIRQIMFTVGCSIFQYYEGIIYYIKDSKVILLPITMSRNERIVLESVLNILCTNFHKNTAILITNT